MTATDQPRSARRPLTRRTPAAASPRAHDHVRSSAEPPPGRLGVSTRWVGRRAVLAVSGEIDMASADRLEAALKRAIDAGALDIWVDLTATEFMDSTGLNLLLALQRRLHELNRQLAIICPGGVIRRTFEVARLDTHLPLFAARSEAQRRR